MTEFVLVYNPALGNRQARVSRSAVDDWAQSGWLLVGGDSPMPTPTYLTTFYADTRYVKLADLSNTSSSAYAAVVAIIGANGGTGAGSNNGGTTNPTTYYLLTESGATLTTEAGDVLLNS